MGKNKHTFTITTLHSFLTIFFLIHSIHTLSPYGCIRSSHVISTSHSPKQHLSTKKILTSDKPLQTTPKTGSFSPQVYVTYQCLIHAKVPWSSILYIPHLNMTCWETQWTFRKHGGAAWEFRNLSITSWVEKLLKLWHQCSNTWTSPLDKMHQDHHEKKSSTQPTNSRQLHVDSP